MTKIPPSPDAAIACIGKFDALHRGHRALVERAAGMGRPVLLTFDGMPETLGWHTRLSLVPRDRWATVLRRWALPVTVQVLPFATLRDLSPAAFVRLLRDELGIAGVVVGEDFRFGHDRVGDTDQLVRLCAEAGLACAIEPPVTVAGITVSSSRIREAVRAGDLDLVNRCLGRPYRLYGRVAHGDGRGHRLGYPTANLVEPENLVPGEGVYAGRARLDGHGPELPAAISIGRVPTVAADHPLAIEAHLIDFDADCYGRQIRLEIVTRLRDQIRFAGLPELHSAIARDVAAVREIVAD